MIAYELSVGTPVEFAITGKFVAPDANWVHLSRTLTDYELIVVTEGVLYLAGGTQHFTVSEGEYLLLPPSTEQFGYQVSTCSFYWLHFAVKEQRVITVDAACGLPDKCEHKIVLPCYGRLKSLEKMIIMMKQLQDSVRSYRTSTLNDYMSTVVLCELYNQLFHVESSDMKKTRQEQLYHDIVDYIKWSRGEPVKVSQIAEVFGYNEKYLSHLFASISGVSLKQYILQQKMELAKYLLTDTNQNISEVSLKLGYTDSHNFMKAFKKIVGLTPSDFRNAYAKRLLFYE
ncbi:AraC family transcriptional regulator [Saccharibacillus kuerlensis]|uniref:HTH-type transcriptional regulator YisR n=1 Tax=Saccharibacillus kuerlensis TaxID=459527 RepID=A0ABQ2KYH2_9BACL|nr:AraC family transcriptional regulator [Saccharibacillus kuerlensis]GGN97060.1 putative HTH-type transcriptional regulator YisR [Saccharibacillus kuerlensis]